MRASPQTGLFGAGEPSAWSRRGLLSTALWPVAALFGLAVAARRTAYRRGWMASLPAGAPVVVIGNISVGGTGKTPITGWLAQRLMASGVKPAVVSRGYGGQRRSEPVAVTARSDAAAVGDEPVMLARQTGCPVWVCTDRARAARRAVREGANIVLSDDGLQHYRMGRNLELCVIDGARGLGNGRLLPAGPLREPAQRLDQVDEVLVQGCAGGFGGTGFELRIDHALRLDGRARRPLAAFAGQRVQALAGIGAPERFYAALESAGVDVQPVPVHDHGRVDPDLLLAGGLPVLMTAKDAVKYPAIDGGNLWWTPARVIMPERAAERLVGRVLALLDQQP